MACRSLTLSFRPHVAHSVIFAAFGKLTSVVKPSQ